MSGLQQTFNRMDKIGTIREVLSSLIFLGSIGRKFEYGVNDSNDDDEIVGDLQFSMVSLEVEPSKLDEPFGEVGTESGNNDQILTLAALKVLGITEETWILLDDSKRSFDDGESGEGILDIRLDEAEPQASTAPEGGLSYGFCKSLGLDEDVSSVMFDSTASILSFKPEEEMRITCLTIGSRGDVQPYIALCKGLQKDGHTVKIVSHAEYRDWVEGHGIKFAPVEGDPAELMELCVEHGMFTPSFLIKAFSKFRDWLDGLLRSAWEACQGTQVLIESPSTMAGIHIAEAMKIPYFRAFTMPWTRTRRYPHAFAVTSRKLGGSYNYMTYTIFDRLFWEATAPQINRWRTQCLQLQSTNWSKMQVYRVPFLYNFSPSVVPPPLDWGEWTTVTGYWFLDDSESSGKMKWNPPAELVDFIAKARADAKKIVYIGFGSIVVPDSRALTQMVIDAVLNAGARCILSKGWSDRLNSGHADELEVSLPDEIFSVKSVPHDWLFPKIDVAVHHGGAGTTGASLRAGIVTVIKPFFGDQYFWATRVQDLGVGIQIPRLTVEDFSRALMVATENEQIASKAKALGGLIQNENGVAAAIETIYRNMEYAKSLIKHLDTPSPEHLCGGSWTTIDVGESPDPGTSTP